MLEGEVHKTLKELCRDPMRSAQVTKEVVQRSWEKCREILDEVCGDKLLHIEQFQY